jgi:uncharacterized damage-inducible protein DinB
MDLRKLYDYNVWANNKIFQHLRTLPEDILHREVPSSFPTIGATLAHIYVSDVTDLSTMKQVPDIDEKQAEWEAETKDASIGALEDCFKGIKEQYEDFLSGDLDFDAFVSDEDKFVSYSDIIQHVVNHSTYHRGNITCMLRQLGYSGVSTDILTYVYTNGLGNAQ